MLDPQSCLHCLLVSCTMSLHVQYIYREFNFVTITNIIANRWQYSESFHRSLSKFRDSVKVLLVTFIQYTYATLHNWDNTIISELLKHSVLVRCGLLHKLMSAFDTKSTTRFANHFHITMLSSSTFSHFVPPNTKKQIIKNKKKINFWNLKE